MHNFKNDTAHYKSTPAHELASKARPALRAGIISVCLSFFLVLIKSAAFVLSGSIAVLSSLVDSILDTLVSGMNYGALRYAIKPADEEHRYGHGKIEGLAALLQAIIIIGAALFLLSEAALRLLHSQPLESHAMAIIVMAVSMVVSALIVMIQNHALHKSGSLITEADKEHYSCDILMHGGVMAALAVQYLGGPLWVDAGVAVLVAGWLLYSARKIAGKGLDMVLDRELPSEKRKIILDIIKAHQGVLGVHDMRAIRSGLCEVISFDIEADPSLSLRDAHAITKDLEKDILKFFPRAEIMIHVDPHGDIEDSRHKVAAVHY